MKPWVALTDDQGKLERQKYDNDNTTKEKTVTTEYSY